MGQQGNASVLSGSGACSPRVPRCEIQELGLLPKNVPFSDTCLREDQVSNDRCMGTVMGLGRLGEPEKGTSPVFGVFLFFLFFCFFAFSKLYFTWVSERERAYAHERRLEAEAEGEADPPH